MLVVWASVDFFHIAADTKCERIAGFIFQWRTINLVSLRVIRLSNGFSRKMENRAAATALNYFAYNFIEIHRTLRTSPAMAAGVTDRLWSAEGWVGWEAYEKRRAEKAAKLKAVHHADGTRIYRDCINCSRWGLCSNGIAHRCRWGIGPQIRLTLAVCLIVPLIVILGLQKILNGETITPLSALWSASLAFRRVVVVALPLAAINQSSPLPSVKCSLTIFRAAR